VCDTAFSVTAAQVACSELYGGDGGVIDFFVGQDCSAIYSGFWLDEVACTGEERTLGGCSHSAWGENTCAADRQCVRVYCQDGGPAPDASGAYAHLTQPNNVLGIVYASRLRGVCDAGFSQQAAAVACRELFNGDARVTSYEVGQTCPDTGVYDASNTNTLFWLSGVTCSGDDSRLADCLHSAWGDAPADECAPEDSCVSVVCTASLPPPDSTPDTPAVDEGFILQHLDDGILAAEKDGSVKGVCVGGGDVAALATVACRQLYGEGTLVLSYEDG